KDTWKQTFAPGSKVLHTENPKLCGVVEPDGRIVVVDAELNKPVLKAKMKPDHLEKAERVLLLEDRASYYVAGVNPIDPPLQPFGGIQSNLFPNTGLRSITVNGKLYAFDRETGESRWWVDAGGQQILLEHLDELPVLILTARTTRRAPGNDRMQ